MVRWLLSGRTWIWTQVVGFSLYAFNYCLLFCLSLCVLFWFSAVEGQHLPVCCNSWVIFLCILMVLALSVCKSVFCVPLTTLAKYWILGVDAEAYELAQLKKTNHPMYKEGSLFPQLSNKGFGSTIFKVLSRSWVLTKNIYSISACGFESLVWHKWPYSKRTSGTDVS